jgi:single-stranded DNA-binding protein
MNGVHVAATGRVITEPEQRFTGNGKALVQFTMLVDQGATVATENRPAPAPTFLRVTAWEPSDELLAGLRKGANLYAEGKLSHSQWTANDGSLRCGLNLSAWRVDVHAQLGKGAPSRREAVPA